MVRVVIVLIYYMGVMILQSQNDWLRQYFQNRQQLLFELIRLEAPPPDRMCTKCVSIPGTYRCKDCLPNNFYCGGCCISVHELQPFHQIQRFTDGSFESYDLDNLGFRLDICPHSGSCVQNTAPNDTPDIYPNSDNESDWEDDNETLHYCSQTAAFAQLSSDNDKMIIFTSTGIFKCKIQCCTCPNALE